jgi:5-methylcytosine-specific restriction endonuclease McrA
MTDYEIFTRKLRSTARYLLWKKSITYRDQDRCTICSSTEALTVHHLKPLVDFVKSHGLNQEKIEEDPEFYNLKNGKTVCRSCHLEEHMKGIDNE